MRKNGEKALVAPLPLLKGAPVGSICMNMNEGDRKTLFAVHRDIITC